MSKHELAQMCARVRDVAETIVGVDTQEGRWLLEAADALEKQEAPSKRG